MSDRSLRQRPQRKEAIDDNASTEAEKSKRKVKKRAVCYGKNSVYDEYGNMRSNGLDICDCMKDDCCGCWYECQNCGSTKCGPQCRVNRKFFYECIVHDGKDLTITNKHATVKIL